MKKSIGTILKSARKKAGLKIEDVQKMLLKNDIHLALKTIYGWENDFSMPNINIFLLLCKHYGIKDILKTFGYESKKEKQYVYFCENEYSIDELNDIQRYAEFIKGKRNR